MPHKCVRCSSIYPNNSPELMRGCTCGSRVFLYLRDETAPHAPLAVLPSPSSIQQAPLTPPAAASEPTSDLEPVQPAADPKVSSSSSDYGWLEDELAFLSKDKPVSVEVDAVENLRILEKGAYEIDLPSLFKGEPLVIKSDQHVYYVKLPQPRT